MEKSLDYTGDYVVFGGTFDPIHSGHVAVVKELLDNFNLVIVAPTTRNPWKETNPTPLPLRIQMINIVLKEEFISLFTKQCPRGVRISTFKYVHTEDLVKYLRQQFPGTLHWAIGEDSVASVSKWKNFDKLDIKLIPVKITVPIHATDIRNSNASAHPSLKEFLKKHKIY